MAHAVLNRELRVGTPLRGLTVGRRHAHDVDRSKPSPEMTVERYRSRGGTA